MNRLIQASALALLILGMSAARAPADMVIALGNDLNVAPGGIGFIDIAISYTPGTSTDNTLADFALELHVAPVSATSQLQFVQGPDPYTNSNYVFYGQSFKQDNGPLQFWNLPSSNPASNDTLTGGDAADPSVGPGYVTIPPTGAGTLLLGTVEFQAAPGATPGDSFQISLVNDPLQTYFDGNTDSGIPYTYNSLTGGMVTIGAVPEPSSLVLAAIACVGGLLGYRRSRR